MTWAMLGHYVRNVGRTTTSCTVMRRSVFAPHVIKLVKVVVPELVQKVCKILNYELQLNIIYVFVFLNVIIIGM